MRIRHGWTHGCILMHQSYTINRIIADQVNAARFGVLAAGAHGLEMGFSDWPHPNWSDHSTTDSPGDALSLRGEGCRTSALCGMEATPSEL